MNLPAEILARAISETSEELEQLADLLVDIDSARHHQHIVQHLVLEALTRVENCKLILHLEARSLNRRPRSVPARQGDAD